MPPSKRSPKEPKTKLVDRAKEDLESLVLHTVIMRLSEAESLAYLKGRGHDIKKTKLYSIKKALKEKTFKKAYAIASKDFLIQHMKRVETLETIEHELWFNYNSEPDPSKRSLILERIANIQPYIATAYDRTRMVIEKQEAMKKAIKPTAEPGTIIIKKT